jgi:hypothetical protein
MSETEKAITGGCFCGKVRFEFEPNYLAYRYCFCGRCRKIRGSAHAANIFVAQDAFRWLAGEDEIKRFDLEGARFGNCFCGTCGSPVPRQALAGKAYLIPAGTVDEDPGIAPEGAIFWDSRASWLPPADTLEKFSEYS